MHIRAFGLRATIVLCDEFLSWKVLRDAKSMGTADVDSLWYYIYTALHWTPSDGKWKLRTCMYVGTGKMVSYQADMTLLLLVNPFYLLSSYIMWVGCSSVSTATLTNWSICLYPSYLYSLIGQKYSSALVLLQHQSVQYIPNHVYMPRTQKNKNKK